MKPTSGMASGGRFALNNDFFHFCKGNATLGLGWRPLRVHHTCRSPSFTIFVRAVFTSLTADWCAELRTMAVWALGTTMERDDSGTGELGFRRPLSRVNVSLLN